MIRSEHEIRRVFPRFKAVNVVGLPAAEILKFLVWCRSAKRTEIRMQCNVRVILADEFAGQMATVDVIRWEIYFDRDSGFQKLQLLLRAASLHRGFRTENGDRWNERGRDIFHGVE